MHDANKLVRVLTGERLKYTVRLFRPDLSQLEWQATNEPKLVWLEADRSCWWTGGEYGGAPITKWRDGDIMLVEENPKA